MTTNLAIDGLSTVMYQQLYSQQQEKKKQQVWFQAQIFKSIKILIE